MAAPTINHVAIRTNDLEKNRPTEVGVINGSVVRWGAKYGVPTPVNSALEALVGGIEVARGLR